ncbi:hypothetical protein DFH09DRAFT_1280022 [Mycena vulgaris]|nr:hypothetical protein DFH09DRAFT_1280022 [Mycena vulgaris]
MNLVIVADVTLRRSVKRPTMNGGKRTSRKREKGKRKTNRKQPASDQHASDETCTAFPSLSLRTTARVCRAVNAGPGVGWLVRPSGWIFCFWYPIFLGPENVLRDKCDLQYSQIVLSEPWLRYSDAQGPESPDSVGGSTPDSEDLDSTWHISGAWRWAVSIRTGSASPVRVWWSIQLTLQNVVAARKQKRSKWFQNLSANDFRSVLASDHANNCLIRTLHNMTWLNIEMMLLDKPRQWSPAWLIIQDTIHMMLLELDAMLRPRNARECDLATRLTGRLSVRGRLNLRGRWIHVETVGAPRRKRAPGFWAAKFAVDLKTRKLQYAAREETPSSLVRMHAEVALRVWGGGGNRSREVLAPEQRGDDCFEKCCAELLLSLPLYSAAGRWINYEYVPNDAQERVAVKVRISNTSGDAGISFQGSSATAAGCMGGAVDQTTYHQRDRRELMLYFTRKKTEARMGDTGRPILTHNSTDVKNDELAMRVRTPVLILEKYYVYLQIRTSKEENENQCEAYLRSPNGWRSCLLVLTEHADTLRKIRLHRDLDERIELSRQLIIQRKKHSEIEEGLAFQVHQVARSGFRASVTLGLLDLICEMGPLGPVQERKVRDKGVGGFDIGQDGGLHS